MCHISTTLGVQRHQIRQWLPSGGDNVNDKDKYKVLQRPNIHQIFESQWGKDLKYDFAVDPIFSLARSFREERMRVQEGFSIAKEDENEGEGGGGGDSHV